jgi:hypothetical protein
VYSPTSELGKITKSSPFGSLDYPFNPLAVALGAEATFVARTHDMDRKHMMETFRRAGEMAQIKQGDQVAPAQPFMKIVDSNSMQVEARINQVESEDVHIGQLARVNFDAFPGLRLEGKVRSVGAMGVGGWNENYYIRNLPVVLSLQTTDNRVIPDLSASGDIVVGHKENVLLAPLEAVETERGKPVVMCKVGTSALGAAAVFPKEIVTPVRKWMEANYMNIQRWSEMPKGGHFAAFEQPDLFVRELRDYFRTLRERSVS